MSSGTVRRGRLSLAMSERRVRELGGAGHVPAQDVGRAARTRYTCAMRGKSGLLWAIAGVVLVAGLFALNATVRPNEAELEPVTPPDVRSARTSGRREHVEPAADE